MKEAQLYKVSIIIPVYNAQSYLNRCLDSVLNQTLQEFEVIVVNDGSTDRSLEILNQYKERDSRITVITIENSGQSVARNVGINRARGEYIGFVDADDWIDINMYKKMYLEAVHTKADIVICNHNNVYENKYKIDMLVFEMNSECINLHTYGRDNYIMDYIRTYRHGNEVWSRIYKRSLIIDYGIIFSKNKTGHKVEIGEDLLFNLHFVLYADNISVLNEGYYNYYIREGSSMTSYKPLLFTRMIHFYQQFIEDCQGVINVKKLKKLKTKMILSMYEEEWKRYEHEGRTLEFKEEWKNLKDNSFVKSVFTQYMSKLTLKEKIIKKIIWHDKYGEFCDIKKKVRKWITQ